MVPSIPPTFCRASVLIFAMAATLCTGTALSQQLSQEAENPIRESAFSIGERLEYQIEWDPPWYLFFLPRIDAGNVFLSIAKEIDENGRKAVVIEFKAKSSGALANLTGFKIDDDFQIIADAKTFCGIRSHKKEREGKRKHDIDVVYLPETGQLHIHDVDVAVDPPVVRKDADKDGIPECVKDIFSALYWLRERELSVGMKYQAILGYNDRVKEVASLIEKKEWVEIPSGRFETFRLNTLALMGGLFKDGGQFRIWLSADKRKMPLQFEVKVSLGKIVGKLQKAEN
jgi:hypothetical protein